MVQRVVFYWQHDIDLVALAAHPDFPLAQWMKRAVSAYARSEPLLIPLPSPVPCDGLLDTCSISFRLNPERDADVIRTLLSIRSGYRNAAIKAIFRGYLDGVYLDPYEESARYFTKSRVPENRRTVEPSPIPLEVLKAGRAAEPEKPAGSHREAPVKTPSRENPKTPAEVEEMEAPAGKHPGESRGATSGEQKKGTPVREETPAEEHGAGLEEAQSPGEDHPGEGQGWDSQEEFDLFGAVDNLR